MGLECGICFETFNDGREAVVTKCGHMFHMVCTTRWLKRSTTCPHCRKTVRFLDLVTVFLQISESSLEEYGRVASNNRSTESKSFKLLKDRLEETEEKAERYRLLCTEANRQKRIHKTHNDALRAEIIRLKAEVAKRSAEYEQLYLINEKRINLQSEFKRLPKPHQWKTSTRIIGK